MWARRSSGREALVAGLSDRGIAVILAGALAVALQLPGLGGDFVFDDVPAIATNPLVDGRAPLGDVFTTNFWGGRLGYEHVTTWRPLTTLSFRANWEISPTPGAFRLVNALLHGIVCVLVGLLAVALGRLHGGSGERAHHWRLAAFSATFFAVMPVHVEAVQGAVNRAELLAAIAWLAGLLGALRGLFQRDGWGWWCFAVAWPLGLLAKEHTITLPAALVVVFAVQELRHRREPARVHAPAAPPLWVLVWVVAVFAAWWATRRAILPAVFGGDIPALDNPLVALSGVDRVMSTFAVFAHALRLLVAPVRLGADYGLAVIPTWSAGGELAALLGLAGYVGVLIAVAAAWRREAGITAALLLFGLTWLPVSSLLVPSTAILGERLLYLPSVFVAVTFAALASRAYALAEVRGGRRLVGLAMLGLVAGLGTRAVAHTQVFRDGETLFRATVEAYPESVRARHNLADALHQRGRADEAEIHALVANRLAGGDPDSLQLLAQLALGRGDIEQAHAYANESLGLRASRAAAGLLCRIECSRGQWLAAERVCGLMARNVREEAEWSHRHGVALLELGRTLEARQPLEHAAALEPGHPGIRAALHRSRTGDSAAKPR